MERVDGAGGAAGPRADPQARSRRRGGSRLGAALVLAPLLLALHNAEEALTIGRRLAGDLAELRARVTAVLRLYPMLSLPRLPTAHDLYASLVLATAVGFLIFWIARWRGPRSGWTRTALWLQGVVFLNVLAPHLLATLLLGRYTPGLGTAVLVELPFSLWLFRESLRAGVVGRRGLAAVLLISALTYGPVLWLLFRVGGLSLAVLGAGV